MQIQRVAAPAISIDGVAKKTGNAKVDALLNGGTTSWWHDDTHSIGTANFTTGMSNAKHTLTYSFMASANSAQTNDNDGFQAMNARTQQAVRDALAYVAQVADITFVEDNSGSGNIQFGTNAQHGVSGGYAYSPNTRSSNVASVYMANDVYNQDTTDWSAGTSGGNALLHEIGHALGLKHPGSYNAGGGKTPGPYLKKAEDNTRYSLMSYKDPADGLVASSQDMGNGTYQIAAHKVQAASYEMYDIAALQYLYGRSHNAAETGAQTYSFADNDANHGEFFKTVSNSNASSRIDASGISRSNLIDLRAGHYSSIGIRDPYGALADPFNSAREWAKVFRGAAKPSYSGSNNFGVAEGSHIDNATGGSAADTIVGNDDATNAISSGDGNDTVFLGKASSTVDCGNGTDTVCLPKMGRSKWDVQFDANTGTYTCRNGSITNVITGAESIKGWNGKTLKATRVI